MPMLRRATPPLAAGGSAAPSAAGPATASPDRADIAHLLRRAGFGGRQPELDAGVAAGYEAIVASLLAPDDADPGAAATPPPQLAAVPRTGGSDPAARKTRTTAIAGQLDQSITWWIQRMTAVRSPFTEKRTWFWHGHFATADSKVRDAGFMLQQNQTLRQIGGGDFQALVQAIVRDPAMMIWLDASGNTRTAPNENLGRELMELFTLGVGNYSEDDVRAAARALTGWRLDYTTRAPVFTARNHDPGPETILGQTGSFDDTGLVQLLVNTPASRNFVVTRIWNRFAAPGPVPSDAMGRLQAAYGPGRNLTALFQALLLDPVFRGPTCRYVLVKQPVEYVVGTLRLLNITPSGAQDAAPVRTVLTGLGQVPFDPPNVGGWPSGTAWLTTGATEAKLHFAQWAADRADLSAITASAPTDRVNAVAALLGVDAWTPRTASALAPLASDPKQLVAMALVSAEYQLN